MTSKEALPFRVENNILIGEEYPINNEHIGDRILNAFKSKPEFIGQIDAATEKQSTYWQMRDRSVKCAIWMKRQGIKPGDIITICTHNQLDAYIPLLASLYIGAIANPWNERTVKSGMQQFLTQCAPKIIFVNDNKAATVLEITTELNISMKIIVFGEAERFESIESILSGDFDETEIEAFSCVKLKSMRDTAAIEFSSGTTGFPKGVEIPHAALINWSIQLTSGDVALWFGSLSWITVVLTTVNAILLYVKVIKFSGFDKEKTCQLIEKYKVTWVMFEASMCNQLFKSDALTRYNVSSLKTVVCTGSAMRHEVHEGLVKLLPHTQISSGYGLTELCSMCAFQQHTRKIGSNGPVVKNVRMMIADLNTGKALGPNMSGEIYCKSVTMMNGYYKNPEATTNAIDSNGWLHTGDLGYYDEDGDVFVVDRIKHLIKYKGYQVSPAEIETVLKNHPAVYEVVVVPVPHDLDQEHPLAFVKKIPGAQVTEEELVELVAANLDETKKLRKGVIFLEELPRVPNGKIDIKQLRQLAKNLN